MEAKNNFNLSDIYKKEKKDITRYFGKPQKDGILMLAFVPQYMLGNT